MPSNPTPIRKSTASRSTSNIVRLTGSGEVQLITNTEQALEVFCASEASTSVQLLLDDGTWSETIRMDEALEWMRSQTSNSFSKKLGARLKALIKELTHL